MNVIMCLVYFTIIISEVRTDGNKLVQNSQSGDTHSNPISYAGAYIYYVYKRQYLYFEGQLDRRVKIQVND